MPRQGGATRPSRSRRAGTADTGRRDRVDHRTHAPRPSTGRLADAGAQRCGAPGTCGNVLTSRPLVVKWTLAPEWAWLWREVRPFALYQMTALLCILAASACAISEPLLLKRLIDDVLIRGGWRSLAAVTALLMLAMVIRVALSSLGNVVSTLAVQHTVFRARTKIVRHVQSLSASFHARRSVGELVQCLDRDVMIVGELGSDIFPALARTVVGLAMSVGVMVYLDWRIASIIVPLLPCLAYVRLRYRSTLQRAADAVRQTTGRTSSLLHEILTGVVQIQLLGAERRLTRRYARLSLRTAHEVILQRRQLLIFNVAAMSVTAIGVALIIGYGGARVLAGSLTIGDVVAFYGCVAAVFAPMTSAIDMFGRMDKIRASLRRLVEIEETPDVVDEASGVMPPLG